MTDDPVDRARLSLAAARHLLDGGFYAASVSRSYYAAFYAAEAAIGSMGETRSKHAGVIAGFNRVVIKSGGLDQSYGEILRGLFEDRNEADYGQPALNEVRTRDALAAAERFVDGVATWLGRRTT